MGGAVQVIAAFVMWNVLRDQDLDADVDHELV